MCLKLSVCFTEHWKCHLQCILSLSARPAVRRRCDGMAVASHSTAKITWVAAGLWHVLAISSPEKFRILQLSHKSREDVLSGKVLTTFLLDTDNRSWAGQRWKFRFTEFYLQAFIWKKIVLQAVKTFQRVVLVNTKTRQPLKPTGWLAHWRVRQYISSFFQRNTLSSGINSASENNSATLVNGIPTEKKKVIRADSIALTYGKLRLTCCC